MPMLDGAPTIAIGRIMENDLSDTRIGSKQLQSLYSFPT